MAFERVGLGGKLTFEEAAAVASLRNATRSFDALLASATRANPPVVAFGQRFQAAGAQVARGTAMMRGGLGQMRAGATSLAMGLAPMTLAMAGGVAKAASFEKQMSAVSAITRASADEMAALTAEAKKQGIVSVFSASQSAEAMENLGRAGFKTTEILDSLGGVMAAAAAEGITLAESSDVIARVVRGMGQEAADASHVADILALTSAKSNTTILDLGESFKYGATQAKAMGIPTEEVAATFGKLADAGLRGSVGGTAFTNMLVKLAKPSKEGAKQLEEWGISLTDSTGAMRPLSNIIEQFKGRLDKIPDTVEKARIQTEIFGIRGAKAYSALALAGGEALSELTRDLEESSFGLGAAQEAANKRLDNFLGSLVLFGSSLEAVSIEFFGPMLKSFQGATEGMTNSLNSVLLSVQGLKQNEESMGVVAARVGKEQAKSLVAQSKLFDGMTAREKRRFEVAISGLTREAIVSEKLTGEQLATRDKLLKQALGHSAVGKQMSAEAQARHVQLMGNMIEQRAAQQKIQVEARAMLENERRLNEIEREHGTTARIIAQGVLDAIEGIKAGFATVIERIKSFARNLKESIGEEQLRRYVKLGTTIAALAGIVTPVMLGLGLFTMIAKGAILPVLGLGKAVWGLGTAMLGLGKGAAVGISAMVSFVTKVGGLSNVLTLAVFKLKMGFGVAMLGIKTAALGTLGVLKGGFAAAMVGLKGAALGALGLIKGAFLALLPVIWPIVLIGGALVGAFMLIRKEGESVGETFGRVWEGIKSAATAVWAGTLKPIFDSILAGFQVVADGIAQIWGTFWEWFKGPAGEAWQWLKSTVSDAMTAYGMMIDASLAWWAGLWDGIKSVAAAVWTGAIKPIFDSIWGGFKLVADGMLEIWQMFWEWFKGPAGAAWQWLQTQVSAAMETLSVWIDGAKTWFADLWGGFEAGTSSAMETLGTWIDGATAWFADLWDGVKTGVASAMQWVDQHFGGVFATIGTWINTALAWWGNLWNSAKSLLRPFVDWVIGIFDTKLGRSIKKIFTGLADIVLAPFRLLLAGLLKIADALPAAAVERIVSKDTLDRLQQFAKHGFAGPKDKTEETVAVVKKGATESTAASVDVAKKGAVEVATAIAKPEGARLRALSPEVQAELKARAMPPTEKNVALARAILDQRRLMEQEDRETKRKAAEKELRAEVKVEDNRKIDIRNKMCVDGEGLSVAKSRHEQSIFERSGGRTTPFIRRRAAESGTRVTAAARA
jgi:TP901 family phage tail tape measure protein